MVRDSKLMKGVQAHQYWHGEGKNRQPMNYYTKNAEYWASEMALSVKAPAANDTSFIPGTHIMERKNRLP